MYSSTLAPGMSISLHAKWFIYQGLLWWNASSQSLNHSNTRWLHEKIGWFVHAVGIKNQRISKSIKTWLGPSQRTCEEVAIELLDTQGFLGGPFSGSSWRFLGLKPLKKHHSAPFIPGPKQVGVPCQPDLITLRDGWWEKTPEISRHHDLAPRLEVRAVFFLICISYWVVPQGPINSQQQDLQNV